MGVAAMVESGRGQEVVYNFVTQGDETRAEWNPPESQLQLLATIHQHILGGTLKDAEFAQTVIPLHQEFINHDTCLEMSRTDNLGPGNTMTPNAHISGVAMYLRTDHVFDFYPEPIAKMYVSALRLAALHHDDGKVLGATNANHPEISIHTFRAIIKKLSDLGMNIYPAEVLGISEKLIRTHHSFQDFPTLVYPEHLAKLQKFLIHTMRAEVDKSKTGVLRKRVRTRHHQLLILLLSQEIRQALHFDLWLEKYPEFKDDWFAHLALLLNEAD
ncbi:MAG: hypothetical protein WAU07_04170, partial [Microgenomates group bacterium]